MAFVPKYILILFATIVSSYVAGVLISRTQGRAKSLILWSSVLIDIGFLAFFKYYNFFVENVNTLASAIHWNYSLEFLQIVLPIGLSFHTFQALSYVIEVYKGKQVAEKHFGIFALYVMYYPQLVAGPIERPQHLLHQFHKQHVFNAREVTEGLKRMAWGFFKKMVIADHLAIIVNAVYANPHGFNGPTLIMATVFFAFQLYCDFSGYSDIAVGASKVMGITLMENFERPYFSKSIAEFWRRWHISLSSWLRDYVYYPVALSTRNQTRYKIYAATLVTFLISGLWHGAAWNYVAMGGIFGFYIVFGEMTKSIKKKMLLCINLTPSSPLVRYSNVVITFCLVCVGWVFFRASSVKEALFIVTHFGSGLGDFIVESYKYNTWKNLLSLSGLVQKKDVTIALVSLAVFIIVDMQERSCSLWVKLMKFPVLVRWLVYYMILFGVFTFGLFGAQQFIYFQF